MPKQNRGARLDYREDRGVWEIIWFENGRRRRKSTGTGDRRDADKALADWLLGHEPVSPRDPAQRRIADVLTAYAEGRGAEAVDGARIGYAIKALLPFWGNCAVGDVREQTCRAYAKTRGKSAGTVRRELSTLRSAINYDFSQGRLTATVPVWLPPKPDHKDRWLTRSEAAALLWAARKDKRSRLHLPLFILLALYTGARKEAILSLRWPQVDLRRQLIDFNPPGRERTSKGRPIIPIPRRLMTFLRLAARRSTPTGYVIRYTGRSCAAETGPRRIGGKSPEGLPVGDIKHAFATAACNAGMGRFEIVQAKRGPERRPRADISPHVLRHTCATWMTLQGVPFPVIGRYLGHTDSRTTEAIYAHHAPDYLAAAVRALDQPKGR